MPDTDGSGGAVMVSRTRVEAAGISAGVYTGGEGEPVLLVHGGWGGAELHWAPVWDRLAERYRVVAPDLPGIGDPTVPTLPGLRDYAGFLAGLLRDLGLPRAHLVGNSLGAAVAWQLASTHPEQTRSLVLVDGGPMPALPGPLRRLLGVRPLARLAVAAFERVSFSPGTLGRGFADPGKAPPELLRVLHRREGARPPLFDLVLREARSPRAAPPAPRCPILVLWGAEDRLSDPAEGERLAARLPGARLAVLPNAGHLPQVEQPDAFLSVLEDFLQGVGP